ncbi:MAG: class I SAM-dependent methyltransferase [Bacteroidales bacterium]
MQAFDQKARTWDDNPIHHERSQAIATLLLERIPIAPSMKALEMGAGTGILSFLLKDKFQKIVLMDSSPEMIRVSQEKIVQQKVTNLFPVLCDLEKENFHTEAFDVIFSQMVFHHITDIEAMARKLYGMLKEGGYIAIADLYPEDGSFHGEHFEGHKGFDADAFCKIFESVGFKDLHHEPCYTIRRKTEKGEQEFPIFLMTGKK